MIEVVVEQLSQASRPVIVAGNGVRMSMAQERLRQLAEMLGIPVATTAAGKGVFPETSPLALGVFGNFGLEAANAVVGEADFVLAVGTKLGPTDTANENPALLDPERQTFVQIDIEPRHTAWTFPAEHSLIGDANTILAQLIEEARLRELPPLGGRERVAEAHSQNASFDVPESTSDMAPVRPQRLIKDLQKAVPDDCIITCDAGENRLFMMHHFQTKGRMEYLQPAGVGGMGYAVPAALAAKLVHPHRTVVAVCGDGGFGIGMNGLLTALEEDIPIVVVIFNNSMLGWVRHGQGDRTLASRFRDYDIASIARAMGCEGFRVEQPAELTPALVQAMGSGRPAVVDVVTSGDLTFRDVTSRLTAYP
jgi:acetolactate synthase-1/2/3 large subunit